jgi:hypothetical protein
MGAKPTAMGVQNVTVKTMEQLSQRLKCRVSEMLGED